MYDVDVLVLGSGPGGQKAAIAAAKLGRRVAVVERRHMVGGVCINTGTIPSKTLREAVLHLTGLNQRKLYGQSYRLKEEITVGDLAARTQHVVGREVDVIRSQLARNRVRLISGEASFHDGPAHGARRRRRARVQGQRRKDIIAVGTRPAWPSTVEFDEQTVIDSDGMTHLERVPRSMFVVGAGVIGIEYASMFAELGTKVTVVEWRDRMLEFADLEVVEALKYHLRDLAVAFRFSETVAAVERHTDGAITLLESGKRIAADTVMYYAGRQGTADRLSLANAGLTADERGRIAVDARFRTEVEHIYAVGDVIGFPALASTSMEQGRLAAHHACAEPVRGIHQLQPIGIYTIPEISFVGCTEDELTERRVPFEVGVARYRELARGQIIGDSYGMLKSGVFDRRTSPRPRRSVLISSSTDSSSHRSWYAWARSRAGSSCGSRMVVMTTMSSPVGLRSGTSYSTTRTIRARSGSMTVLVWPSHTGCDVGWRTDPACR